MLVIHNENFQLLQQLERAAENYHQRKELKYSIIERVSKALGRAFRGARKVASVIDEIVYKATDRGYSFNGRETLADKLGVSPSTVDRAIKLLKKSEEVTVAYRENPNSNGVKTPVLIFKNHPNYNEIIRIIGANDNVNDKVENPSNPTETSDSESKKVATYYLPEKQESNNNISDIDKIRYIIDCKIMDSINKGNTIKYVSSYVDRVFRSLKRQALYAEAKRQAAVRRQREEAASRRILELEGLSNSTGGYQRKVPFYNWLED